jgi:O-acetyl-ADP-ribose deacetylase (regulator of RNase III)
MGKGLALRFKHVYPEMFMAYQTACRMGTIAVGRPWLYKTSHKWVLNFPTKRHWRDSSRLDDIAAGLAYFTHTYADWGITSIAFPALGCGEGHLVWSDVHPLLEHFLQPLSLNVWIYPPLRH